MDAQTQRYVKQRQAEIALRLREARAKQGWSQEQVAEVLGCSREKMNRVENGRAELTLTELEVIARALKISVNYFVKAAS